MRNQRCLKWAYIGLGRRLKPAATFIVLILSLFPSPASAAIDWSLSVVGGYYFPKLTDLNYILRYKEVELGPRNTNAKPSPYPVIYQGLSPDNMPDMGPMTPQFGLQVQADINPRYAVVFGESMATLDSTKRDIRPFFVGFSIPATRETRFSLTLNQFWLGIRRHWTFGEGEKAAVRSQKQEDGSKKQEDGSQMAEAGGKKPATRFYAELGILAVTRAYLTTDVWLHVYAPEEGFDFYKITQTESQGNGYANYLGAGGEYYLSKWLSLCLDIDYITGTVANMKFHRYFTVDPLEKDIIKPGDQVIYYDFIKGQAKKLTLDLGGWDIKGQLRFYLR